MNADQRTVLIGMMGAAIVFSPVCFIGNHVFEPAATFDLLAG